MEATHVVVFSELSPKTKVQYTRFLLDHDVKFVKHASDGKYAASIRLHAANNAPHARSVDGKRLQKSVGDERGDTPEENPSAEKESSARLAGVPQELHQYVNLIALIGGRKDGGIKRPSGSGVFVKETRLVRLINEIYDARQEDGSSSSDSYSSNALDGNDGPLGTSNKSVSSSSNAFTHFIKHYLTNRFGLKKLVEQQAWELIEGLHSLQHRVDVELFTSFLRGRYSESTLLFTLFARATIQRLMSSSAYRPTLSKSTPNDRKTRKSASTTAATTLVWLSKAQVESLAQTIFGSKTEDSFLEVRNVMSY
ncbi:NPP1 protein [Globisporangium polare]